MIFFSLYINNWSAAIAWLSVAMTLFALSKVVKLLKDVMEYNIRLIEEKEKTFNNNWAEVKRLQGEGAKLTTHKIKLNG